MYVRFRRQANRVQASIVETRRVDGKVVAEHIGALGSVDAAVSLRERIAFWTKLPGRLASLGNRVGPDEHAKLYAALYARIPMPTLDEQRSIQEENAKDAERFWDAMHDISASAIEGHNALIAKAEKTVAKERPKLVAAAEKRDTARQRLESLARGENVSGGLGKKLDVVAVMKAAGFSMRQMKQMRQMASLSEEEFSAMLKRADPVAAVDKGGRPRASPSHSRAALDDVGGAARKVPERPPGALRASLSSLTSGSAHPPAGQLCTLLLRRRR
jgi:hypothetical protein